VSQRGASRLAQGIGVLSAACVVAAVVLLVLDWKAIDSPYTSQAPWIANAIIIGALGLLIVTRDARNLIFDVKDDGKGFDTVTAKQGAGLANMHDRADALGGVVEVTSQPGAGTHIRCRLPVEVRVPRAVAV
jgi:hypothetical protein